VVVGEFPKGGIIPAGGDPGDPMLLRVMTQP